MLKAGIAPRLIYAVALAKIVLARAGTVYVPFAATGVVSASPDLYVTVTFALAPALRTSPVSTGVTVLSAIVVVPIVSVTPST